MSELDRIAQMKTSGEQLRSQVARLEGEHDQRTAREGEIAQQLAALGVTDEELANPEKLEADLANETARLANELEAIEADARTV